jgi:hypothetical protein
MGIGFGSSDISNLDSSFSFGPSTDAGANLDTFVAENPESSLLGLLGGASRYISGSPSDTTAGVTPAGSLLSLVPLWVKVAVPVVAGGLVLAVMMGLSKGVRL